MSLDKQVMSLWAAGAGKLDQVPVQYVKQWESAMHAFMDSNNPEIGQAILRTKDLQPEIIDSMSVAIDDFNTSWQAPQ